MAQTLLDVEDVDVTYGGAVRALRGVSLAVPEGGIVTVLGSNGAGKSTLLRAISRSLGPVGGRVDRGRISFDGQDLAGWDTSRVVSGGVVLVPEGRRVFRDLSVDDNLVAGGYTVRNRAAATSSRARVLELFPILSDKLQQKAGLLSGGQQQMLAIGRALMTEPRLLLLDEPSLGLAPQLVEQMGQIITEINRRGTSVLLIEQNASMGLAVADTAYVLSVGEVTAAGPAAELANGDEIRERYLGGATTSITVAEPARGESDPSPVPAGAALHLTDVTVRFSGVTALDSVGLTIAPGSIHALIGPNGAGKSTCINVLSGAYRATEGAVTYGDRDITALNPHRVAGLGIARTFQNLQLSPDISVRDVLMLGRHRLMRTGTASALLRLPASRREEREHLDAVRRIAATLSLEDVLERRVDSLSYGDLKRVELGRALAAEPQLLLLDEPVAGMTHGESQEVADIVRVIRAELDLSILLVEHDMPFVMGLAEQVTVLDFGRVVADGTPEEVQRDPDVIRAYLGTDAA